MIFWDYVLRGARTALRPNDEMILLLYIWDIRFAFSSCGVLESDISCAQISSCFARLM